MKSACVVLYLVSLMALLPACMTSPPVPPPIGGCLTHSSHPVMLTMYYSSEKQAWIDDVVQDFNRQQHTSCAEPIIIKAIPSGSGESMQEIVDGTIHPDIWSPAGSAWLSLINGLWQAKYHSTIVPTGATDTPSLVLSPLVIAMWKPEAEALDWPKKALGWTDIASLSTNPLVWAAYKHPEWGNFTFSHTNPISSNSGLDALMAEYYVAADKARGLTGDDLKSAKVQDFVRSIESSIIHYDESTSLLADKMFKNGPGFLSAAVMYENLVVQANNKRLYPHLPYPVVAIYPKEGTFYSDHPFVILQVDSTQTQQQKAEKKAAALIFRSFLLAPNQQRKALQYGFRPTIASIKITAPIDSAHGVDPQQLNTILPIPERDVVKAIQTSWGHHICKFGKYVSETMTYPRAAKQAQRSRNGSKT